MINNRSTQSIWYFPHLQIDGVNGFLQWSQSTEDGYSQVSVVSGRLHRNHVRTASPFSAEVGERGTVIIQRGRNQN